MINFKDHFGNELRNRVEEQDNAKARLAGWAVATTLILVGTGFVGGWPWALIAAGLCLFFLQLLVEIGNR